VALRGLNEIPPQLYAWAKDFFPADTDVHVTQFPGGANNLVFGCVSNDRRVVAKLYPQAADPSSDRFRAEREFLTYADTVAPGFAPKLLDVDTGKRILVMEYLDGTRFDADAHITREDTARAARFLACLNADLHRARGVITVGAAEGFLHLTQHVENVDRRLADLGTAHLPAAVHVPAQSLIDATHKAWDSVKSDLQKRLASGGVTDTLAQEQRCISPSDFGFHNAMRCAAGIRFFDFEFAGWDDPAKAVADFFLQPRIHVPEAFQCLMEHAVATCLPATDLTARVAALRPVLHIKWVTIILAVLRPQRLEAMLRVTVDKTPSALIQERLTRAQHYLSREI
jgi:hypothetical protein